MTVVVILMLSLIQLESPKKKMDDLLYAIGVLALVGGKRTYSSYHWVPRDQPIYLQLHNAGGHGTKAAIEAYKSSLQTEHNVIVINQPPRSPDSNVLDLGLWMAIQSNVDYIHQTMTISTDSVAKATQKAWSQLSKEIIGNVFGKLPEIWTHMAAGGRQQVA
jgi:hypothetical protein